jgi:transposase
VVCYEAGFSGFSLARKLIAQQIECFVMAPVQLDAQHSRVANDRLDSGRILSLLDRYLAGNVHALTPVRIPTPEEEIARADTRQLEQLQEHARAMQAQGRSLLYFLGLPVFPQWWQDFAWNSIQAQLPAQVKTQLTRWRGLIEAVEKQIAALSTELQRAPAKRPAALTALPLGLGLLTWLILDHEVMDWQRFTNRRQPGKFCGLIPSESSTGQSVRYGSITKVGNPRIRRLLIEAVWRLVRYQPHYHAFQKWGAVLKDERSKSKALRKKAVVAVARLLMVDLWRLATGQTTQEKLGLIPLPVAA